MTFIRMFRKGFASLVLASVTVPTVVMSQPVAEPQGRQPAPAGEAVDLPKVDAEVRRVDKAAKKITLRHGPIPNLDMPPMSMVFQVRDAAWLEQFKAGDRVRISADKVGGAYVVMQIEPAP